MSKDKKEDRNILDETGRSAGSTKKKFRAEDMKAKEDKNPYRVEVLQAAGSTEKKIRVEDTKAKEGTKENTTKKDEKSNSS